MMTMLNQLIKSIAPIEIHNPSDILISDICYRSTDCKADSLFVAIAGVHRDGHSYIPDAVDRGARTIIYSDENTPLIDNITFIRVEDTRKTLAQLSNTFFSEPSKYLNVVAITGTNGKSTFCDMARYVFTYAGQKAAAITTLGYFYDELFFKQQMTTPPSRDTQYLLRLSLDEGASYVFMEASSHGIDQKRIDGILFDACVFSNLSNDHLDYHITMEAYYQAKKRLFTQSAYYHILNIDDLYGKRLAQEISLPNTQQLTFSFYNPQSTYRLLDYREEDWQVHFTFKGDGIEEHFTMNTPGKYNVYNAAPVIIYAMKKGIDIKTIKEALSCYPGLKGRMQHIRFGGDIDVVIDYAHTPDGMHYLLEAIKKHCSGRIITVFGCGGERDRQKRPVMGNIASQNSDITIITEDNPRSESAEQIADEIYAGIKNTHNVSIIIPRFCAIEYALSIARPGDCVVLAGKGHEEHIEINNKLIPFRDEDVVYALKEGALNC